MTAFFCEVGTTSVIFGGVGSGAHFIGFAPFVFKSRSAHFFHSAASASSGMKTPPTTERAWKPACFGSVVSYQSVIGLRWDVSLRKS